MSRLFHRRFACLGARHSKYPLDHSFMRPGLVAAATTAVALALARWLLT